MRSRAECALCCAEQVTMAISILFILLSTATLLIQSVPCLFYDPVHCHKHPKPKNSSPTRITTTTTTSTTEAPLKSGIDPHFVFESLEALCVGALLLVHLYIVAAAPAILYYTHQSSSPVPDLRIMEKSTRKARELASRQKKCSHCLYLTSACILHIACIACIITYCVYYYCVYITYERCLYLT